VHIKAQGNHGKAVSGSDPAFMAKCAELARRLGNVYIRQPGHHPLQGEKETVGQTRGVARESMAMVGVGNNRHPGQKGGQTANPTGLGGVGMDNIGTPSPQESPYPDYGDNIRWGGHIRAQLGDFSESYAHLPREML
jgi:hypothetical protein